jgi:hypothetical protein
MTWRATSARPYRLSLVRGQHRLLALVRGEEIGFAAKEAEIQIEREVGPDKRYAFPSQLNSPFEVC